jgi:aspartate 1-decarboxylase
MLRKVLHSKIHRARVTAASVDYMGSITIDADLLEQAGMRVSDAVLVANCRNGARFETYIFRGEPGSREIVVNGAAAHLVDVGDELIIFHFAYVDEEEYKRHRPTILIMRPDNTVERVLHYEPGS